MATGSWLFTKRCYGKWRLSVPTEPTKRVLTPSEKAACEAVCKIRCRADSDGCECATNPQQCGCEEIALAAIRAWEWAEVSELLGGKVNPIVRTEEEEASLEAHMKYVEEHGHQP
jgi:hypothetical protein